MLSWGSFVRCHNLPSDPVVWTRDQFASEGDRYLIRERVEASSERPQTLVLVVDGSSYFTEWYSGFRRAVEVLKNRGHKVRVVCAAEGRVTENEEVVFVGGQNNMAALRRGSELAVEEKADHLIWLHGIQPVDFDGVEEFLQAMERSFSQAHFSVMDLGRGPNRLLEKLESRIEVAAGGRPAAPEDLSAEFLRLIQPSEQGYHFRRSAEGVEPEGREVWDQLARHYVHGKVMESLKEPALREAWADQASRYQLVTPVSGAIVLETQQQYQDFGLKQVDVSTTPSIPGVPEPSTALLLLMSTLGLLIRRR